MDTKVIADIPSSIIGAVLVLGMLGIVQIHPLIIFFGWVLLNISMVFQSFANIISGGYKNDHHRNQATGDSWREGMMAGILLYIAILGFPLAIILWRKVASTNIGLLVGTVFICLILGYLNVKFRYYIFKKYTPEEKAKSIKLRDLVRHLRWYNWVVFVITFILILSYIFS